MAQPTEIRVSVGDAVNRALFVLRTDTGQFASDADLLIASGVLRNLITASSAGVSTLNGLSGIISLSGVGGTTVYTGANGIIYISGSGGGAASLTGTAIYATDTGNFATSLSLFQSGQYLWTQLGNLSGQAASLYALKADTGNFVSQSQTGGLATALNLSLTGQTLLNASGALRNDLVNTGATLEQRIGIHSGYAETTYAKKIDTGDFVSQVQTGGFASAFNLYLTGQHLWAQLGNLSGLAAALYTLKSDTGQFASDSDLLYASGYLVTLIQGASAGVSTLNGQSGILDLVGAGSVSISTGAGQITVSGNTGQLVSIYMTGSLASALNLADTGQTLATNIYNLSGLAAATYALKADTGNFVSAANTGFLANVFSRVSITGSDPVLAPIFTGLGNVTVSMAGSVVRVSGTSTATTGTLVYSTDTGQFVTSLQTGQLTGAFVTLIGGSATIHGGATIANGQLLIGASGSGANCFQQGDVYGQSGIGILSGSGSLGVSIDQTVISTVTRVVTSGADLDNKINTLSGYANTAFALKADTGNFVSAANTGFLANVFSRVSITGSPTILAPNYTGAGSVTVSILGSTVTVSGAASASTGTPLYSTDTGAFATILSLATTGQTLATHIYNFSGLAAATYALKADTGNFVSQTLTGHLSRITVSGLYRSAWDLTGVGNVAVVAIGSTVFVSGTGNLNQFITRTEAVSLFAPQSATGNFVSQTQTGGLASSLNLFQTGQTLWSRIDTLSGYANSSFALKQDTGNFVSSALTGFLANIASKVSITGSSMVLLPNFTGAGNVTVSLLGSTVTISGTATSTGVPIYATDTGSFATSLNLAATGQTLATNIYNLSGLAQTTYALKADTGNFVSKTDTGLYNSNFSKVSVTGGSIILAPNLIGTGSVTLSSLGNSVIVSGTASTGGSVGTQIKQFGFSLDGATTLTSGIKGYSICPYAGTISSWTLSSRTTGGITIDVYKSGFSNVPTNSIITDNYPKLTGNQFQLSSSLVGWSTSVSQNDVFGWFIRSGVTGASQVSFTLNITL